jgi:hypothetical protein
MNLKKLTEIKSSSQGYDSELKNVVSSYSLKSVYVNPTYVIFMKANDSLENAAKRGVLVEGLDQNIFFTQVALSAPGMSPTMINIVGSPEQVAKKLQG